MKMILFDLDGTLLPMDQEEFTKTYFNLLIQKFAPYGWEAKPLIAAIWAGMAAMVGNDGRGSNEAIFWQTIEQSSSKAKAAILRSHIDDFYREEFQAAKASCQTNPQAAAIVKKAKQRGYRIALATNPIFPKIATASRMRWAGLDEDDFELCTTYENTSYCKPNPDYYRDIAKRLHIAPTDCLMVGNDVTEDMAAATISMKTFLLTDCLINSQKKDISHYPNGSFDQLSDYLDQWA